MATVMVTGPETMAELTMVEALLPAIDQTPVTVAMLVRERK